MVAPVKAAPRQDAMLIESRAAKKATADQKRTADPTRQECAPATLAARKGVALNISSAVTLPVGIDHFSRLRAAFLTFDRRHSTAS
jgi:hypothetical protein